MQNWHLKRTKQTSWQVLQIKNLFLDLRCVVFRIDQEEFTILFQTPVCVIQHDALCSIKLTTNVLFFQDIFFYKNTFLHRNGSFKICNFKYCFRNKNCHQLVSLLQLDFTKNWRRIEKKTYLMAQEWGLKSTSKLEDGVNKVWQVGNTSSLFFIHYSTYSTTQRF